MPKILKNGTTVMIALLKCWQTDVLQTFLGKYEITGQKTTNEILAVLWAPYVPTHNGRQSQE